MICFSGKKEESVFGASTYVQAEKQAKGLKINKQERLNNAAIYVMTQSVWTANRNLRNPQLKWCMYNTRSNVIWLLSRNGASSTRKIIQIRHWHILLSPYERGVGACLKGSLVRYSIMQTFCSLLSREHGLRAHVISQHKSHPGPWIHMAPKRGPGFASQNMCEHICACSGLM